MSEVELAIDSTLPTGEAFWSPGHREALVEGYEFAMPWEVPEERARNVLALEDCVVSALLVQVMTQLEPCANDWRGSASGVAHTTRASANNAVEMTLARGLAQPGDHQRKQRSTECHFDFRSLTIESPTAGQVLNIQRLCSQPSTIMPSGSLP